MSNFTERRSHSRLPFKAQVLLDMDGRPRCLTVAGVDVSHSGACLNVPLTAPLDAGSRIKVKLPRPGPDAPALPDDPQDYRAEVVRVDRASRLLDGLAIVGLQFN